MSLTPQTITIDLNPSFSQMQTVHCSQYDDNIRQIEVKLKDGGTDVDVSSYTIYIEGTKPDKHGFSYPLTDIGDVSGNTVTFYIQLQMAAVPGMTRMEILLKDGDDHRIGSANFMLAVERAGLQDDTNVSDSELAPYISGAAAQAQAAANSAAAAEQAKDDAIQAKESAEQSAESISGLSEQIEQNTEDCRDLKNAFEQLPTSIQPDMSVGNVFSDDSYTEDKTPYLYRVSGGGVEVGKVEADEIVGGTIAWNQLSKSGTGAYNANVGTKSYDSSTNTFTVTNSATAPQVGVYTTSGNILSTANHKYLLSVKATNSLSTNLRFGTATSYKILRDFTADTEKECATVINPTTIESFVFYFANASSVKFRDIQIFDLTQMFGSTIADYLYSLETATAGAGVAVFRKMFPNAYYPYNAGELLSVSGLQSHDMVGKNLCGASFKLGVYANGTFYPHANSKYVALGLIPVVGGMTYTLSWEDDPSNVANISSLNFFEGTTFIATVSQYINKTFTVPQGVNQIAINLMVTNNITSISEITISNPMLEIGSLATAYEPYEKHSYPLDSTLTLRGIPKLDASNNLYYDGDVYSADGKVTRRYGVVDLGTLNWQLSSSTASGFYAGMQRYAQGASVGMICAKYPFAGAVTSNYYEEKMLKCFVGSSNPAREIYIKDSNYSDAASFKAAMSGVILVYELETPTEETAEPFTEYQKVSKYGTEEYVSTGIVPVGHVTKYPADIVSKVDGLPSDFSTLIAPTEKGFTATRAYSVNQFMIINNQLYKATASIANGATITVGTNVTATTIADILTSLLNA